MKSKLLKILLLSLITITTFSCSKTENKSTETPAVVKITSATIVLKKANGDPVSGITVYAYNQSKWQSFGDNPTFADGQAASDANGNAIFPNIEYGSSFDASNNNQNNFRFSARYSLGGVNKSKVVAITFLKGEQKSQNIVLD